VRRRVDQQGVAVGAALRPAPSPMVAAGNRALLSTMTAGRLDRHGLRHGARHHIGGAGLR